jgi:hypothetical protein
VQTFGQEPGPGRRSGAERGLGAGFTLVNDERERSFGKNLIAQEWEREL